MAEVTAEEIGKLRELAEAALERSGSATWLDADHLARGLLSALDALEAANRIKVENAEAAEWWKRRAKAAEDALEAADFGGRYGALLPRLRAAEASRDQAIKERDELKGAAAAGLWTEAMRAKAAEIEAERDRLAEALRDVLPSLRSTDPRAKIIRAALAGVPGGSPEEHNPGGTAVAVPGSETAKARGEGCGAVPALQTSGGIPPPRFIPRETGRPGEQSDE